MCCTAVSPVLLQKDISSFFNFGFPIWNFFLNQQRVSFVSFQKFMGRSVPITKELFDIIDNNLALQCLTDYNAIDQEKKHLEITHDQPSLFSEMSHLPVYSKVLGSYLPHPPEFFLPLIFADEIVVSRLRLYTLETNYLKGHINYFSLVSCCMDENFASFDIYNRLGFLCYSVDHTEIENICTVVLKVSYKETIPKNITVGTHCRMISPFGVKVSDFNGIIYSYHTSYSSYFYKTSLLECVGAFISFLPISVSYVSSNITENFQDSTK